MTAPVVLISFVRPDLTRRNLARIREAAPSELFVISDGPRPGHPTDAEQSVAARREIDAVDWPCTVHRLFSDENRGINATFELGLDWVFEQTPEAIILEDDCLPDPTFFPYATELLERYRDDERVVHVAGETPVLDPAMFDGASYAFISYASIWGWATWARAWKAHRADFPRTHVPDASGVPDVLPRRTRPVDWSGSHLLTGGGTRFFKDVSTSDKRNDFGWDAHWLVSGISRQAYSVTPAVNLVENLGVGEQGTNTKNPRALPPSQPVPFPLHHPAAVAVNAAVELEFEHRLVWIQGRLARVVARLLPQGRLRTALRNVANLVSHSRAKLKGWFSRG